MYSNCAALNTCLIQIGYISFALCVFSKDFIHLFINCESGEYEVWYTEGTHVYLPEGGEYEVSGNNMDGFIVTCKVS